MNANLRGNVLVKGLPIEDFIRKVANKTETDAVNNTDRVKQDVSEVTKIVSEKMRPLEAFQDEKKILSETLNNLGTRVKTLEAMDMSKLVENSKGENSKQVETKFKELEKQLEGMQKQLEKKIMDIGVGCTKQVETKFTELEKQLERVQKQLEKKIVDMEKKIVDMEKKIVDMKPRRGVDQATMDSAIVSAQKTMESRIQVLSDSLAQLRSELEEE